MTQVDPPVSFVLFSPLPNETESERPGIQTDDGAEEYFRNRERSERAAAKRARTCHARSIHQELALAYAAKSREVRAPRG